MTGTDWNQAAERADQIAECGSHPADSWDGRAIRGILTVTLAGLAAQSRRGVADVETGVLLWHLDQGSSMVYEIAAGLGLEAEGTLPAEAASTWAWLTRPWPKEPPLANSDGMPRGIGRGSSKPAVEVVTPWALGAVRDVLTSERPPGLSPRARIRVTGGDHEGREGEVISPAWLLDDEHRTVRPGPPHGYEVALDVPGSTSGPRTTVVPTLDGEIVLTAPGPQGERLVVQAQDLALREE